MPYIKVFNWFFETNERKELMCDAVTIVCAYIIVLCGFARRIDVDQFKSCLDAQNDNNDTQEESTNEQHSN